MFKTSKRDKRKIKHAQLLSKISKSQPRRRRRRPAKRLVTTLDSLLEALPDETVDRNAGTQLQEQVHIIQRQSVTSRSGALKRREKLDKSERDRFANNMAQMAISRSSGDRQDETGSCDKPTTSARWTALRGFISQTLERRNDMKAAG